MNKIILEILNGFGYRVYDSTTSVEILFELKGFIDEFLSQNVVMYKGRFVYTNNIELVDLRKPEDVYSGRINICVRFNGREISLYDFFENITILK